MTDSKTKSVLSTQGRGITLSGIPTKPLTNGVLQTNVYEIIAITRSTQNDGEMIHIAGDAE